MGRRAILGDYGLKVPQSEHGFKDSELLTGTDYAKHRGVSRQRVHKNWQQRLINQYLNSKGKVRYHPQSCDQQWETQSDPKTISIPTTGQRQRGWNNDDAQENAGDFSTYPTENKADDSSKNGSVTDKEAKTDNLLGKARAKTAFHKAQMAEYDVLKEQKKLVNRDSLARPIISAAQVTRDRIMGVPNIVVKLLYSEAHADGDLQSREHKMKMIMKRALKDALVEISEMNVEDLL